MELINELKRLVAEERKITAEILRLLLVVEDTRLFAERGFSSVFEFCTKELGLSEGAAYRRVSAMRLLRREESCAEKIESGELSLTAAAKVETVLRQAEKENVEVSKEQQEDLMASALGTSSREAEKRINEVAEEIGVSMPKKESPLPASIDEKLEKLKALISHQFPHATKEDLLNLVLDEAIEKRAKKQGDIGAEVKSPGKRHVPEKLKAAIFQRDEHRCTYVDPLTGRKCGSTYFLEIDHLLPLALGGKTCAENLRVLCRTHNRLMAEQAGVGWWGDTG